MMVRKVAIIGAGISGLLACKYCLSKGFCPTIFESQSSVGGVWTKTLEITKLQTAKDAYQFSDFPWPPSVTEDFPGHDQVLEYIQSYSSRFDLLRHIRFNCKVVSISYEGPPPDEETEAWALWGGCGEPFSSKGKWKLTLQQTQNLATEVCLVDFVILCAGRFCDVPNIPEFPPNKGPKVFEGKVMHSMDYAAMDYKSAAELVKGKKVTVVGLQKSAMDIAMECSTENGVAHPCTVVYRTEHWNIPNFLAWGIPLSFLYFNRFSELLVHKPGEDYILSLLATILSPLRWGISKFVESYIKSKLQLAKFNMVPKYSFFNAINSCVIASVPKDFYSRVEKGSIKLKKAHGFGFSKEGILIDGEVEPLKTDLVILATGFRGVEKLEETFTSPKFKHCIASSPDATFRLYRDCIHPQIPQLAMIGFSESYSNLYTSELRCRWLAELLDATFKLPSIKEMEKDVGRWDEYMKQYSSVHCRQSCIGGLTIWYNDQLCKDMGWNPKRKKGFIAELFEPYGPMDYVEP